MIADSSNAIRSILQALPDDGADVEALAHLLTYHPNARFRGGFVHSGTWTVSAVVDPSGLQFLWLGRAWTLPPGPLANDPPGPVGATLTLSHGLLRARSQMSEWGPLRVRPAGVIFWEATSEELRAATGVSLGRIVEGKGRLSMMADAFEAAPGVDHAGQNVVVCFGPCHLWLFDIEGHAIPTAGVLKRTDPRPKATVTPQRWDQFLESLASDSLVENARRHLLNRVKDQPDTVDADGRSLLLAGLLMGEVLNSQGHIVLYNYNEDGKHRQGYAGSPTLARQAVVLWLVGPYLRLYKPDGELVATRSIPHPVAHEFGMFRPWRGRDVHLMSIRRRTDVERTVVTAGSRLYTLISSRADLKWLLTEERFDQPPRFWLTDGYGELVPLEPHGPSYPSSSVKRRLKLLSDVVGSAPEHLLLRVVERFGERLMDWYLATAPPPQDPFLQVLYVSLLGWWARRPTWDAYHENAVMDTLAWWRRVGEIPKVLSDVYRTPLGIDISWPELTPADRQGWAEALIQLGLQARVTDTGVWVTARSRA
ncbi:MAG TPA: hypothetical protein VGO93_19000 [Candidatus Xenobia bacterium]